MNKSYTKLKVIDSSVTHTHLMQDLTFSLSYFMLRLRTDVFIYTILVQQVEMWAVVC